MITVFGDAIAPLVLPQDSKREKPRTLLIRCLSKNEVRKWQKKVSAARDILDVDARDAAYDAALAEVVTGWKNIEADFSIAGISDAYMLTELTAMLDIIPMAMTIGADDQKK